MITATRKKEILSKKASSKTIYMTNEDKVLLEELRLLTKSTNTKVVRDGLNLLKIKLEKDGKQKK